MDNYLIVNRTLILNEKYNDVIKNLDANKNESSEWYFQYGRCLSKLNDFNNAEVYYSKAVELNHPEAAFYLGNLYDTAAFGERDVDKALYYYNIAAEYNYPLALFCLYKLYYRGDGVQMDTTRAIQLLVKAAEYGDKFAEVELSDKYKRGDGVEKNLEKAFELASSSFKKGNERASAILGELYVFGDGCSVDYEKGFYHNYVAANAGYIYSMYLLGNSYLFGEGTAADKERAFIWFKKATDNKCSIISAYVNLGRLYNESGGKFYDPQKALEVYKIAKDMGDIDVCNSMGDIYKYYYGDNQKAYSEYCQAYDKGSSEAAIALGLCYLYGEAVQQSVDKAYLLFEEASKKGNGRAYYWIGQVWENGWLGGKKDYSIAKRFYENAIHHGFEKAREDIERLNSIQV